MIAVPVANDKAVLAIRRRVRELGMTQAEFAYRVGRVQSWVSSRLYIDPDSTLRHLAYKEPETFQRLLNTLRWSVSELNTATGFDIPTTPASESKAVPDRYDIPGGLLMVEVVGAANGGRPHDYAIPVRRDLVRPIRAYGYRDNQPYEPEAKWVRQMFEWALSRGRYTIARRLNDLGVPTARGGTQWRVSNVGSILANPVFKGSWQYGRRLSCPGCGRRDRLPRNMPRTVTYSLPTCRCGERMRLERYEVSVPAIIDPELWGQVNDRQRARYRERSRPGSRTDTFPLQGRAFCALCGSAMSGHRTTRGHTYYHCRGSLQLADRPRCEHNRYYRADEINMAVREALQLCLEDDEALRRSLELPVPEPVDYERERAQLGLELQNYIRLAGRGLITDDELAAERERLERALALIPDSAPPLPMPQARHLDAWRERMQGSLAGGLHAAFVAADVLVMVAPEKQLEIVLR